MRAEETGDMFVATLGRTNVMMGVRGRSNIFGLRSLRFQFILDVANACLAPFYPSHLLYKISTVRSRVPSFGTAMFKFALEVSVSRRNSTQVSTIPTMVVL